MSGAFSVSVGIRTIGAAATKVVVIGQNKLIKQLDFTGKLAEKLASAGVDDRTFNAAISQIRDSGPTSLSLHLNLAKLVSVSDETSRYNAPSNSLAIFKEIKGISASKGVKNLNIVLYTEYAHAFASFCSVARCFPLYTRKTLSDAKEKFFEKIHVELVLPENEKQLSDNDINFLQSVADSIRESARLVDMPCNELHTEAFANAAISFTEQLPNITKTIIKGEELLTRGFGGIYHVGKAAAHGPIFLCLSYTPSGATESIAMVGKGIVYDTGGMQIKTKSGMPTMKSDMGGAAAVLGAFVTLVRSGFNQSLHCILCIAENSVSPVAIRPDDVIRMLSGVQVEINNTDAEGRLVLADGVYYAMNTLNASTIVDVATLTGYQLYATGAFHAGILANNQQIENESLAAGKKSGDLVFPFLFAPDLHFDDLKSEIADFKNACLSEPKGVPSAVAGLFIGKQINYGRADEKSNKAAINWLHIDMASQCLNGGRATGYGVAHLCALFAKHTDVDVAKD